jgi:hypothetical protein
MNIEIKTHYLLAIPVAVISATLLCTAMADPSPSPKERVERAIQNSGLNRTIENTGNMDNRNSQAPATAGHPDTHVNTQTTTVREPTHTTVSTDTVHQSTTTVKTEPKREPKKGSESTDKNKN